MVKNTEKFLKEQLISVAKTIRLGKAPALDGVSPNIGKVFAIECGKECLEVLNGCFENRVFPRMWKRGKLVLVGKKVGMSDLKIKYRPLCLLNVKRNMLERLIGERIMNEMPMPEGVELVGYTDDLAQEKDLLRKRVNKSVRRAKGWITKNELVLASKKSKSLLLVEKKKLQNLEIQIGELTLKTF